MTPQALNEIYLKYLLVNISKYNCFITLLWLKAKFTMCAYTLFTNNDKSLKANVFQVLV